MTENDLLILQNFATLWARVTGEACTVQPSANGRVEALELLYTAAGSYAAMGRRARGGLQNRLFCMQREAETMIRHLQAGLYLDTNDTFIPVKCRIFCKLTPNDLQKLWRNATELSRLSNSLSARETGDEAEDLAAAAALGERHARALREILACVL